MKIFFFILFLSLGLIGREISLQEINSYPKSIAKDFYIWQYLQQPWVSKEDAEKAYKQVSRVTFKIKKAFRSRGGIQQFKTKKCKILSIDAIFKSNNLECIKANLTPKRVSLLDGDDLARLIKKFKKVDKDITLLLMTIYYSQDIEKTLYANPEIYLDIFLKGGSKLRKSKKVNKYLSGTFLQKLVKYRWKFKKFIATILTSSGNKFQSIEKSLLQLKPTKQMQPETLFSLGFNLIRHNKIKQAKDFFQLAYETGYYQINRDRANFWLYLITKDKKYLKKLSSSWDINIYTIYAREELKQSLPSNIISKKTFYDYNPIFLPKVNIENPFDWLKVVYEVKRLQKIDKSGKRLLEFANFFKSKNNVGAYFYILERGYRFKKQSFPTPYQDNLKDLTKKDQALIYALARQESRFIPSVISTSYALGMMQIMPFLVKDIAKRKKEKINLEDMFNPAKNLEYAIYHIKDLKRKFTSPLFIAYAYNGGMGFTKKLLKKSFKKGKFEPFLSIETIPFPETRKYGKKVLANYIIYRQILGKQVSLHDILEETIKEAKKF